MKKYNGSCPHCGNTTIISGRKDSMTGKALWKGNYTKCATCGNSEKGITL